MNSPGPLAARPRQIVSFDRLDDRLNDPSYEGDPLKAYYDIAGGIGKGVMIARAVNAFIAQGLRLLVVVPRTELGNQQNDKFEIHFNNEADIALIHSRQLKGKAPTDEDIDSADAAIITNSSLIKRIRSGRLRPLDWDGVFWDEAHLDIGPGTETRRLIQEEFAHAFQMALTASGEYDSIRNVANVFGPPVDSINTVEGVEGNLLASIKTSVVRSGVRIGFGNILVKGDYDPVQMQKSVNVSARNMISAQLYASFADRGTGYRMLGERGIIYCAGVDHARQTAALFNREIDPVLAAYTKTGLALSDRDYQLLRQPDIEVTRMEYDRVQLQLLRSLWKNRERGRYKSPALPAALIHGSTSTMHQELIHDCFDYGLIKAVANADMWTFGIDKPFATFGINSTPTASLPRCIQRGTRPDRLDPQRYDKVSYIFDVLDEDVWEAVQEAAASPKRVMRNAPILFAQVLNWRPSVSNDFMPNVADSVDIAADPEESRIVPAHLEIPPDQLVMDHIQLLEVYNTFQRATEKQSIPITDEMRDTLKRESKRTGIGLRRLSRAMSDDPVEQQFIELNLKYIAGYSPGNNNIANQEIYDNGITYLGGQPDEIPEKKLTVTAEVKGRLAGEMARVDIGAINLVRYAIPPEWDVKEYQVRALLSNPNVKEFPERVYWTLIEYLAEQPDKKEEPKIELTEKVRLFVEQELKRTEKTVGDIDRALTKSGYEKERWTKGRNLKVAIQRIFDPTVRSFPQDLYDLVVEHLAEQPDRNSGGRVPMTPGTRDRLRDLKRGAGLTVPQLAEVLGRDYVEVSRVFAASTTSVPRDLYTECIGHLEANQMGRPPKKQPPGPRA